MSSSFISTVMVHDAICPKGQEFLFRPPKPDPNEIFDRDTGYDGAETTCQALAFLAGVVLLLLALMVGAVVVIGIAMGIAAICGA